MKGLIVRPARLVDVPAVVEIERAVFSDPWSAQSFREALGHPAVYFSCVRRDAGEMLGYVVAWFVADEGEIANLAVARSAWGAGIGRALLDAALTEAASRGVAAVYLEVRESNERARRLYQSSKFEEVGRRRGYYRRPAEDAIVLRRTLDVRSETEGEPCNTTR
jgi:ribosomal-protein-alanine N-acetyltransferase